MTTTTTAATKKIALALIEDANLQADIDEMTELASTANLEVALVFTQNRPSPDPATYMGSGKVKEIKQAMDAAEITTVIFNDELSAIQHANLTDRLDAEVMDRTNLILHIFSMRARTAEGKIQVELARLKYLLPRLRGIPGKLSRQGAGVLARGPGETKLESDKRYLREQIRRLKSELAEIEKQRDVTRTRREKSQIPLIALVGYTNAGKSTLFNKLTNSSVFAENKLFATLDTTIRRTELAPNLYVLISDTVGFIKNLPHHLIDSFKSTLEETRYADIVLNVCDVSNPLVGDHNEVTHNQLAELKVTGKIIDVYNKCDLISDPLLNGCGIERNLDTLALKPKPSKNAAENKFDLSAPYIANKFDNKSIPHKKTEETVNCGGNGINSDYLSLKPLQTKFKPADPRASIDNCADSSRANTAIQGKTEQPDSPREISQNANQPISETINDSNVGANAKIMPSQKNYSQTQNSVFVSALSGQGIEKLKQILINEIRSRYSYLTISLPYSQMGRLDELLTISYDTNLTYHESGVSVKGHFAKKFLSKWSDFIIS